MKKPKSRPADKITEGLNEALDHSIKQIERAYAAVYEISSEDIGFIATALYGRPRASHRDAALKRLYAARENPISEPEKDTPEPSNETETPYRALVAAQRQRDFLMRQVDSLVARLAGAHVAAGLIDFPAAQGFMQKEIGPLNAALAQIAQTKED